MSFKNITVSGEAYELLASLKARGHQDSFSKVILRHLRAPADTCGELLERLQQMPPPKINLARMEAALKTRGRRSKR